MSTVNSTAVLVVFAGVLGITSNASAQFLLSPSSSAKAKQPKTTRSLDERLLFFPSKYPDGDWTPANLDFDDVWFEAADGNRVHGWYCPCEHPRATILICHGNAGNIASRATWLSYLQRELHVTTLMFDYRGYGRSPGVPTIEGVLLDARAARDALVTRAEVDESEIYLMGESLGGAVAVQLAAESSPRALVLQSTFSSLRDVARVHYPALAWIVPKSRLDSAAAISDYRGPLLQSHGDVDEIIPLSSGEALHKAAHDPKHFLKIEGAGHNDWLSAEYVRYLDQFIDQVENGE